MPLISCQPHHNPTGSMLLCPFYHLKDWDLLVTEPYLNSDFCLLLTYTVSSPLSFSHFLYQVQRNGSYGAFPDANTGFLALSLQCSFPVRRGKSSTLSFLKNKAKQFLHPMILLFEEVPEYLFTDS